MTAVDAFLRRVADAPRALLALDYDGTLAPFRSRPSEATPHRGVRGLLRRLLDSGHTRVVVVSGRRAAEVLELLGLWPAPEIWGDHGWERMLPGEPARRVAAADDVQAVLDQARLTLGALGLLPHAEWKAGGVAVHWRGRDRPDLIEAAARSALAPLAAIPGFALQDFAAGVELRCRRFHKGTALAAILAQEAPSVPAAYVGDDLTDEDAFAVLAGRGLTVRVAAGPVSTAATAIVAPAHGVLRFLGQWEAAVAVAPRLDDGARA